METILVIDDDAEMRDVLFDLLSLDGYEVLLAADGNAGLTRYHNALPDLVITDLQMPGMNGAQLLEELKRDAPDLSIVVITGTTRTEMIDDAEELGADRILKKPFGVDELLSALDELLGHEACHWTERDSQQQSHIG